MGWPLEDRPLFQHWTQTLIKSVDLQTVTDNAGAITAWIRNHIAERRADPGDDFYQLSAEQSDRRSAADGR